MDLWGGPASRLSNARKNDLQVTVEARAVRLHTENRRRTDLFNRPIMADSAMDIMLTALIAHEQGTVLSRTAAAMANRLERTDANRIIVDLVAAGLLDICNVTDRMALSPLGADLMRQYVASKFPHSG